MRRSSGDNFVAKDLRNCSPRSSGSILLFRRREPIEVAARPENACRSPRLKALPARYEVKPRRFRRGLKRPFGIVKGGRPADRCLGSIMEGRKHRPS